MHRIGLELRKRPAIVRGTKDTAYEIDDFPNIRSYQFDKPTTRLLREFARENEATINDLLISSLMSVIQSWNERRAGNRPGWFDQSKRPIRVLMTSSLRTAIDHDLPAANVAGFTFVTLDVQRDSSAEQLVRKVQSETKSLLRDGLDWVFDRAITGLYRWRLMWALGLTVGRRPVSTAVLSHLGNLINRISSRVDRKNGKLVVGDVMMTHLLCVPPLRPQTLIGCTTYMESGCLTINLRCDPYHFSVSESHIFLQEFCDELLLAADARLDNAAKSSVASP